MRILVPVRSDFLRVPGATIYHEIRGAGPLLVLVPGGGGDAQAGAGAAEALADRFTVLTFDARGYSRSTLDSGHRADQLVEVQSDDVLRLLDRYAAGPAVVFGGSHGAIVGLDLLARHPERVRTLIAHEPPCFAVLPTPRRTPP